MVQNGVAAGASGGTAPGDATICEEVARCYESGELRRYGWGIEEVKVISVESNAKQWKSGLTHDTVSVEEVRDYIEEQYGVVYRSKQSYYELLEAGG